MRQREAHNSGVTSTRRRDVPGTIRVFLVLLTVAVVAALATGVERARACSCVQPDPWSLMKQADGAFVGRLVDRDDLGQGRVRLRFDVERAMKGSIGSTVDVVTANNSAACGIEMPMGYRTGLFLMRDGGRWTGTLCWQVSPEDMLAGAMLPAPNGRWPAAIYVGGRFGPARTIALDAKGRTLGYGVGSGTVRQVAGCPGGRRVAELVHRGSSHFAVIRDLPTFFLVREQRLPRREGGSPSLRCIDTFGEKLAVFTTGPGARGRLTRITPQRSTTLWRGSAFYASFGRRVAFVQVLRAAGTGIVEVDLLTGTVRDLGTVPVCGAHQLDLSRTERHLAGDSHCEGRSQAQRIVVIDLASRPISARRIRLPAACCGDAKWLDNDRFAYFTGGRIIVYDARLRRLAGLSTWPAGHGTIVGGTAYGVTPGGALVSATLPSKRVQVVRRLPGTPEFITASR
jgi:hypothetical protein